MGITFFMIQTPLVIDSGLILRLIGQNRENALQASNMALITLPGYLCGFLSEILYRTLFAKKSIWPAIVSGGAGALCALLIQLLSLYVLHWVLMGMSLASSGALVTTALVITIIFLAHKFVYDLNLLVPSKAALDDWWEMGVNYASSLLLLFTIRLLFELPVIVGGIISGVELATANILRRYSVFLALTTFGYNTACIAKIGSALGARSRTSLYVHTAAIFLFFTLFLSALTILNILLRYPLARITTNESAVVESSASLTPLVAVYDLIKLFNASAFYSIFRGAGSIVFPTACAIVCEYLFGLPLGIYLSLYRGIGIAGIFWSMIASFILEIILNLLYFWLYVWPKLVNETLNVENSATKDQHVEQNDPVSTEENALKATEIIPLLNDGEQNSLISSTNQNSDTQNDTGFIKLFAIMVISILLISLAIWLKIFFS